MAEEKGWLFRWARSNMPTREELSKSRWIRPLGKRVLASEYWRFTRRSVPRGEMPSPRHPPSGCRFHTRCPLAVEGCTEQVPLLEPVGEHHSAACHLWLEARRTRVDGPVAQSLTVE